MKISVDRFNCNFLLFLFLLYLAQQALGLSGIIGPPILLLILLISSIYTVKFWAGSCKKNLVCWLWLALLFYISLLYLVGGQVHNYNQMRMILLNFLPFFPFYYFARREVLTPRIIKVFSIFAIFVFILNMQATSDQIATLTGREEFANNVSYHVLGLLPFVFLLKRKLFVFCLILLLAWYASVSLKRSVLIVSLFSLVLFSYGFLYKDSGALKAKGLANGFASLLVMSALGWYYYSNIGLSERFEYRITLMITEGHSAGRDILIENMFSAWVESESVIKYLFGLGYGASLQFSTHTTHNDFIMMLSEYGLIGFIVFLSLFFWLAFKMLSPSLSGEYKMSYIMFVAAMVMSAMTSRWLGASFFYMNCVLLPFLLASINRNVVVGSRVIDHTFGK